MNKSKSVFSKAWKVAKNFLKDKKVADVDFGIIDDYVIVLLVKEHTQLKNCGYTSNFVYVVDIQKKTCKFITNNLITYNSLI